MDVSLVTSKDSMTSIVSEFSLDKGDSALSRLIKAIREIERQSSSLEEIKTSSSTIKNGADKILNRVETMRAALTKQIEALDTQAGLLRKLAQ